MSLNENEFWIQDVFTLGCRYYITDDTNIESENEPIPSFISFGDTLNCLKKIKDDDLIRSCGCVVLLVHWSLSHDDKEEQYRCVLLSKCTVFWYCGCDLYDDLSDPKNWF